MQSWGILTSARKRECNTYASPPGPASRGGIQKWCLSGPLSGERLSIGPCSSSRCLKLAIELLHTNSKHCFFCAGPSGKLVCVGVLSQQHLWSLQPLVFKDKYFGVLSLWCKFQVLGYLRHKLPAPQGEALDLWGSSRLWVVVPEVGFSWDFCLFYLFWCGPFIICSDHVSQLIFRSFLNCSRYRCRLGMFMWGAKFRIFLCCHHGTPQVCVKLWRNE